ncbi:MAG: hypothetical protein M0Z96_03895 [Actinomycetota bacterium]|nr:hypothetical protein [Actinomycetota bacterium]
MKSLRIVSELGLASEIHASPMVYVDERTARFVEVTRSALVLGSSQNIDQVSKSALEHLDAELVIRKSGGGAVFLSPMGQLWVDIAIPKTDPLFLGDVGRSFLVIGEIFMEALSRVGGHDLEMHTGRLLGGRLARTICFAGLGPGEITFEGAKVVGMSQRRTANGAVFQCTAYLRYPFDQLSELMAGAGVDIPARGYALGLAEIFEEFSDLDGVPAISQLRRSLIDALENTL